MTGFSVSGSDTDSLAPQIQNQEVHYYASYT